MGPIVPWKRPSAGGGSRSFVGSRRTRRTFGVGSTWPNPSGRSGSGEAPTTQTGVGGEAVGVGDGVDDGVGCPTGVGLGVSVGAATGVPEPWHAATRARTAR